MMKTVYLAIFISLSLASPDASPEAYASDYGYYDSIAPALAPAAPSSQYHAVDLAPSSQYHAQDDAGQYNYGFSTSDQTKSEIKTADGITRGAYSYVDANGIIQSVQYISDALGFRVAATNLPVHDVDSPAAPAAVPVVQSAVPVVHSAVPVVSAAAYVHEPKMAPSVDYAYLPYAQGYNYNLGPTQFVQAAPVVAAYASAPVHAAPVAPAYVNAPVHAAPVHAALLATVVPAVQPVVPDVTGSQYHAQDEAGQYSFGYNDPNSVRQEVKTADGVVRGAYKYVDTDGHLQTVEYIADAAGFRVAASNLPQGIVQLPTSVVDTPEVAAAKIAHAEAYAQADALAVAPAIPAQGPVLLPVSVVDTPEVAAAKIAHADAYAQAHVVPSIPTQGTVLLPVNVVDTPEVAAAKIAHANAYAQAHAAAAIQPEDPSLYDTPATYTQEPLEPVSPLLDLRTADERPIEYAQQVVAATPVAVTHVPAAAGSQFHAQDDFGQYNYGYSDQNSMKQEVKTADGVTRGSYSYVDANGIVQTVNYISDALGFRVGATNLPVHVVNTPTDVVADAAPVEPLPVVPATYTHHGIEPQVSYAYLPYAANYGYNIPEVAANPVVDASNSQFHAQDNLGQYNYGFSNPTQTKQEVKTADGVTRGGYSYIDANGLVQTVNYISDAMGFRVAATNLPVAASPAPVVAAVPAVAAAPVAAAAPAVAASYYHGGVINPQVQYSYLPYAQNYGYYVGGSAPVHTVKSAPSRPASSLTPAYYGAADPAPYVTQEVVAPAPAPYVTQEFVAPAPAPYVAQEVVAPAPAAYVAQPAPAIHAAPVPVAATEGSQYHAQDDIGQYSFGYSDGNSVKQEVKTADGVVRGAYSYVDADGLVQHVNYIADALGFRVGATNLPVHHVDGPVEAETAPIHAPATVIAPQVNYAYLPYASNYGYSVPEVHSATVVSNVVNSVPVASSAPVVSTVHAVAPTPVVEPNSQFHAQDDLGQYNYGYSDPNSVKQEVKTADGVTRGSYSYVDANGLIQTVNYISDAMGFRVAATNLPVHDVGEPVVQAKVPYVHLPYAQGYGYSAPAA